MAEEKRSRRIQSYAFSPELLAELFVEGKEINVKVKNGIPPGAIFRGVKISDHSFDVTIYMQHESFPEIEFGAMTYPKIILVEKIS